MNKLLSIALLGLFGLVGCGGGGGGASAPQASTSTVPAAPGISSFTSTPSTTTAGSSVSLVAVFSNGIGTIIPGNLPATSGAAITVSPTATTTYTLTVTNSAGASVTQTDTVNVAAPSVISAFSADHETVLAPGTVNLIATFTGGTGVIMPGNLAVTSGTPVLVAGLTATTTFTLAVTNSAGTAATMPLTVRVGTVSVLAGNPGVAGNADGQGASAYFSNPQGLTVDVAGSIYVADYGNAALRKITPAGLVSTLTSGMPYLNSVAVKTDGTVYVTTASTQASVTELSPAGVVLASAIGILNGGAYLPWGVAVDGAGDLFIANDVNNAITKITPAGVQSYLNDGMQPATSTSASPPPSTRATST